MKITIIRVMAVSVVLSACRDVRVNPEPLVRLCKQWGGVPLVIPDSRYQPGSIVDVSGKVVAWVDDLEACDVPYVEDKSVRVPGKDPQSGTPLIVDSAPVGFKWDERLEYDASAVAKMPGVVSVKCWSPPGRKRRFRRRAAAPLSSRARRLASTLSSTRKLP